MTSITHTQNELILEKLQRFYLRDDFAHLKTILPIINGESPISLRLIDWFVTNFAKKNFTQYTLERGEEKLRFSVFKEYKLKLKSYKKRRFDPFCRWERICIPFENNTIIQTTIGQLNFFQWALSNKVIDFIEQNTNCITRDMNRHSVTTKKRELEEKHVDKTNKTRKRRQELSISATKTIKKEDVEIVVKFN